MVTKGQESQPQLDLDLAPGKRTVSRSDDVEAVHHPPFLLQPRWQELSCLQ